MAGVGPLHDGSGGTRRLVWLVCQSSGSRDVNHDVPDDSMVFLERKLRFLWASNSSLVVNLRAGSGNSPTPCPVVVPDAASDGTPARPAWNRPGSGCKIHSSRAKNFFHSCAASLEQQASKKAVGLAIVEVDSVYRGILSNMEPEQRALLHYVADKTSRVNSVFVRVVDAVMLASPLVPTVSGIKNYANHKGVELTLQWARHAAQTNCRAQSVPGCESFEERVGTWLELPEFKDCFEQLEQDTTVYALVVKPILAVLAASGLIMNLVFPPQSRFAVNRYMEPFIDEFKRLARGGGAVLDEQLPASMHLTPEVAKTLELECDNVGSSELDRDMLLRVADSLREHLSRSCQSAPGALPTLEVDDDEAAIESNAGLLELQRQIVWVEGVFRATGKEHISSSRVQRSAKGFFGVWNNHLGCYVTYKPAFLLQCVVLSFDLRSAKRLPDVVTSALGCLPEFWKHTVLTLLSDGRMPSSATMTKARLTVDVGYMLWMRQRHKQMLQQLFVTFFMKVDSTPLGGNNWEVVEYEFVEGGHLLTAGDLASSLAIQGHQCRDANLSLEDAEELTTRASQLAELVSHHVLPLGALGTRRSNLEHVVHSIFFRLRLECQDWDDVEKLVRSTFSLTADQGTEGKVGDVDCIDLQKYFPWWPVSSLREEDPLLQDLRVEVREDDLLAEMAPAHAAQDSAQASQTQSCALRPGFIFSIRVPPHFHIIDKVSKAVLDALTLTWPRIEKGFKAVVVFFHARHTRRHFSQLCVHPAIQYLFSSGPPSWDGGRAWGVLEKTVRWLLHREGAIKRSFDLQKLLRNPAKPKQTVIPEALGQDAQQDKDRLEHTKRNFFDDRDGSNMAVCDAAIADPFFWGALHLLSQFSAILEHMQSWMLGCGCHSQHVRQQVRELLGRSAFDVVEGCPMRGRRGPDLATNQHRAVFTEIAREQEDILLMVHLASLSQEDRRDLMLDFAAGQTRIASELDIRLSVWNSLPLKLFSLAFHDATVARQGVMECFVQYEELTEAEVQTSTHDLTVKLLSKTGALRQDLVRWLQGESLSEALRIVVSQMLLHPNARDFCGETSCLLEAENIGYAPHFWGLCFFAAAQT